MNGLMASVMSRSPFGEEAALGDTPFLGLLRDSFTVSSWIDSLGFDMKDPTFGFCMDWVTGAFGDTSLPEYSKLCDLEAGLALLLVLCLFDFFVFLGIPAKFPTTAMESDFS